MHIGQTKIAARVAIGQLRVIEAQQSQNRGVQIMHMNRFVFGLETKFVGRAINRAALDAAARHPHREAVMIVVAPVLLARIGSGRWQFDDRRAAKFAAPDNQGFLQHSALLQILNQSRNRLIAFLRQIAMADFDVIVIVPTAAPRRDKAE